MASEREGGGCKNKKKNKTKGKRDKIRREKKVGKEGEQKERE